MKFAIAWHEQNLINRGKHLANQEANLLQMQKDVGAAREEYLFAEKQIEQAKAKGLDGFDSERFLRPRKEKTND
jgi:hypothetical protein